MNVIDIHTHTEPQYANLAIQVMDSCGIEKSVVLPFHDGFGDGLKRYFSAFEPYPDRFILFGNIDWSRVNEPEFGIQAAEQIRKDVDAGIRGIKIFKALGLEYQKPNGEYWRINDPEFEPIWEQAGASDIPILIHSADPVYFWHPLNERNFWNGVLYGEYDWWTYYRKNRASADELIAERNDVIARHPKTTFICPHFGSKAHSLDEVADDLDSLPNMYVDISARIPILGKNPRRRNHAREFLEAYADRILFGTDMIYNDTNVPTGTQAQMLYQPFEIDLNGADPNEEYVKSSIRFFQSHIDFLLKTDIQQTPPFKRMKSPSPIYGLGLDDSIVRKICETNPKKVLKL